MSTSFLDWIREKQNYLFYGFLLIAVVAFGYFKLFHHQGNNVDYLSVEKAYQHWEQTGENFDELAIALRENPTLETKFGALVAERFILQGKPDVAQPFAEAVLKRVSHYIPEHSAFAKGSILIECGKKSDAFEEAVAMKERLSKDSVLYGLCVLRLASLSRELNAKDQEIAALEELEQFLQSKTANVTPIMNCFYNEGVTLQDYITYRKGCLN